MPPGDSAPRREATRPARSDDTVEEDVVVLATAFTISSAGRFALRVYRWLPDAKLRAAVQIAHGPAESARRFAHFAELLTAVDYAVYGHDFDGSDDTARTPGAGPTRRGGKRTWIDDLWSLHTHIASDHPGLPIILLGHALGALVAQHFMSARGAALAGAVLAGPHGTPTGAAAVVRLIARAEQWRLGPCGSSGLVNFIAPRTLNGGATLGFLRPPRLEATCDGPFPAPGAMVRPALQLWIDLLEAMAEPAHPVRIPRQLPIYVIGGEREPAVAGSRGLEQLLLTYRTAGLQRVTCRLYPGAPPHELMRELIMWLDAAIGHRDAMSVSGSASTRRRPWA
jgi:alpha-beta hydrolase superfamily lysophospholipase